MQSRLLLALIILVTTISCGTIELEPDRGTPQRGAMKADGSNSCLGHCDSQAPSGCWCDTGCALFGDCCPDKGKTCDKRNEASCQDACGKQSPDGCWCDESCARFGDCCPDKADRCDLKVCNATTCGACVAQGCNWTANQCMDNCLADAACYGPGNPQASTCPVVKPECTTDSDCMEIQCPFGGLVHGVCTDGKCTTPAITDCPDVECATDKDCDSGESCLKGKCQKNKTPTCAASDCDSCLQKGCNWTADQCFDTCLADADCYGPGNPQASTCPVVKPECTADSDCMEIACPFGGMAHGMCTKGKCTTPAVTDCPMVECAKNTDCVNNVPCVKFKCIAD